MNGESAVVMGIQGWACLLNMAHTFGQQALDIEVMLSIAHVTGQIDDEIVVLRIQSTLESSLA